VYQEHFLGVKAAGA